MIDIKALENGMKKRFTKFAKEHTEKGINAALLVAQNWAEDEIVRKNGKLTITSENEIQNILDKLRQG